mmetsp:Transcript_4694/g.11670  ORF Transcript_4694/g.11670 Transcript_4694/m.11670 type:complete len:216 (-) Transcript_4694:17-664(-)
MLVRILGAETGDARLGETHTTLHSRPHTGLTGCHAPLDDGQLVQVLVKRLDERVAHRCLLDLSAATGLRRLRSGARGLGRGDDHLGSCGRRCCCGRHWGWGGNSLWRLLLVVGAGHQFFVQFIVAGNELVSLGRVAAAVALNSTRQQLHVTLCARKSASVTRLHGGINLLATVQCRLNGVSEVVSHFFFFFFFFFFFVFLSNLSLFFFFFFFFLN